VNSERENSLGIRGELCQNQRSYKVGDDLNFDM